MGKRLELLVEHSIRTRELRRDASSVANRLEVEQKELETEMFGRLKARQIVSEESRLHAEIVTKERGGNGIPYKKIIDEFVGEHPEHASYFAERIESVRTEPIERVNYGRRTE
ncbi:MAG: hypothetical protein HYS32_01145 [Candidatus Woesearchaeota archaeon]|nr:MAG: hypothetical protein HYS32_01145 [Candidatus Woesearchaeota archaeon]